MEFELGFGVEYIGYVAIFLSESSPDVCGCTKAVDLDEFGTLEALEQGLFGECVSRP